MNTTVKNTKSYNRVSDIIDSLTINPNPDAIAVLEGTSPNSLHGNGNCQRS